MNGDFDLQQQLLELEYGLLPADEADELRRRIASDPEFARAHQEVKRLTALLGEAVRLEVPPIPLRKPEEPASPHPSKPATPERKRRRWTDRWFSIVASVALIAALSSYTFPWIDRQSIAERHLRLKVEGPRQVRQGMPHRLAIATTTALGQPVPADLHYSIVDESGSRLFSGTITSTLADEFLLPSSAPLKQGVTIQVAAENNRAKALFTYKPAVLPERLRTHLSSDRQVYRPGEVLRFRTVIVAQYSLEPRDVPEVRVELLGPGMQAAATPVTLSTQHGVGSGECQIPNDAPPGQYTLVARDPEERFAPAKTTVNVEPAPTAEIVQQLEFSSSSYRPGDQVIADYQALTLEGQAFALKPIRVRVVETSTSQTVFEETTLTSEAGTHRVRFPLPDQLPTQGQYVLSIALDGNRQYTITKTVPLESGTPIEIFPEGGTLAAGLPQRIYFATSFDANMPVEGQVVDASGTPVAAIEATAVGLGRFSITPEPDQNLELVVRSPQQARISLPKPVPDRVFSATADGAQDSDALQMTIYCRKHSTFRVTAECRGAAVADKTMSCAPGENEVELPIASEVAGVLEITVVDLPTRQTWRRSIFKTPQKRLNLSLATASDSYQPGDYVDLKVQTTDESGTPVPSNFGLSVVHQPGNDRQWSDTLTASLLLASDLTSPRSLMGTVRLGDGTPDKVLLDLALGVSETYRSSPSMAGEGDMALAALGESEELRTETLFDNADAVRTAFERQVSAAERKFRKNVAFTCMIGGGFMLLLVAMLAVWPRVVLAPTTWILTTACLLMGSILLFQRPASHERAVAVLDTAAPQVPLLESQVTTAPGTSTEAPASDSAKATLAPKPQQVDMLAESPPPAIVRSPMPKPTMPEMQLFQELSPEPARAAVAPMRSLPPRGQRQAPDTGLTRLQELVQQVHSAGIQDAEFEIARSRSATPQSDSLSMRRTYARAVEEVASEPDFADASATLLWNPQLSTDANGQANVRFRLPQVISNFLIRVDAHTDTGRLGSAQRQIATQPPLRLDLTVPTQVNSGDEVAVPVEVSNQLPAETDVALVVQQLPQLNPVQQNFFRVKERQNTLEYFVVDVTGRFGRESVVVEAKSGEYEGWVQKDVEIVPSGYPVRRAISGQTQGVQPIEIDIPENAVPGSITAKVWVQPSVLAELIGAIRHWENEPSAGLEAELSKLAVNLLALKWITTHGPADPETLRYIRATTERMAGDLPRYQLPEGSFASFPNSKGNLWLTAFAVQVLTELHDVVRVDASIVDRAAAWVVRELLSTSAHDPIDEAFAIWAMVQAGQPSSPLTAAIERLKTVENSDDPYQLALAALTFAITEDTQQRDQLCEKLQRFQQEDGSLIAQSRTITDSGEHSNRIETTALAAMAWMTGTGKDAQWQNALQWLRKQREGSGGFATTQATAHACRAMVQYALRTTPQPARGTVRAVIDDRVVNEATLSGSSAEPIELVLDQALQPGENRILLDVRTPGTVNYVVDVDYVVPKLPSADNVPLDLQVTMDSEESAVGETVILRATLSNTSPQPLPMTAAIVSLPAGLAVLPEEPQRLQRNGNIDFCEIRQREVAFYRKEMLPHQAVQIELKLRAHLAGRFTGSPSRAYLLYSPAEKKWAVPLEIKISRPNR